MILFMDESGQDHRHREAYEVLGGIAIPQKELWPFVCAIRDTLSHHFGTAAHSPQNEIKGTSLLTQKRLSQAFGEEIPVEHRRELIHDFFLINQWNRKHKDEQKQIRRHHFESYAQSCRFFCRDVLQLCRDRSARVSAAVIAPDASRLIEDRLRSDYAGLFYMLYEYSSTDIERRSIVVHDECDDTQCRRLAQQLYVYYVNEGRDVANRVIPEPMFVKSHLTLGVLVADIIAYILSWGFRHGQSLNLPSRPQLQDFSDIIRQINGIPGEMPENLDRFGILYIQDLADLQRWSKKPMADQA